MPRSVQPGMPAQAELCAQLARDLDGMRDSVVQLSLALQDYRFYFDTQGRQKAQALAESVIERSRYK